MTQQLAEPASVGAPRAAPAGKKSVRRAMPRYIAKRLAHSLLPVFLPLSTVFVLIRLGPRDPAYAMAAPLATSEDLAKIRTAMGLDQSVFTQYLLYLKGVLQLDLGTSYSF